MLFVYSPLSVQTGAPAPGSRDDGSGDSTRSATTAHPLAASTPNLGAATAKAVPQLSTEELAKMNDRRSNIFREIYETGTAKVCG